MRCEHYKSTLIETAATGSAPQGGLQAHIASCASCRAAFAEEQSLFAAIDSGLHAAANAEVPPSLLPRVRASLDEAVVPQRRWIGPFIFATASVAFAFLLFLMARPHHAAPDDQAKQTPPIPALIQPSTGAQKESSTVRTQIASSIPHHSRSAPHSTLLRAAASSKPEVLVPPDEREAFARFVAVLNEHSNVAAALLAPATEKKDALVNVDPLQIEDMEIKPLEGTGTEASDRADNKR